MSPRNLGVAAIGGTVTQPGPRCAPARSAVRPACWGVPSPATWWWRSSLWWHVWSSHPTTVTTCGCGDSALFLWFLEWPAYALAHGHNPFFSTALFHPGGINLLANTSVLAIGIPLAPVTWLFGPVATLNVASTLGPALSALAMFWLLRRWVRWTPAALVGGLVFGFSPFVVVNLAGAHLMTGVLVLLPLMVACLDELLVRQQRRSAAWSARVLGLLLTRAVLLGHRGPDHRGAVHGRRPRAAGGLRRAPPPRRAGGAGTPRRAGSGGRGAGGAGALGLPAVVRARRSGPPVGPGVAHHPARVSGGSRSATSGTSAT